MSSIKKDETTLDLLTLIATSQMVLNGSWVRVEPARWSFTFGKRRKPAGAKSGEKRVRGSTWMFCFALLAHYNGGVHRGIVPAQKPLSRCSVAALFCFNCFTKMPRTLTSWQWRQHKSTELVNIIPCWSKNANTICFVLEAWNLALMGSGDPFVKTCHFANGEW
jgi:hypothetical protein